jgi:hypothetical protein
MATGDANLVRTALHSIETALEAFCSDEALQLAARLRLATYLEVATEGAIKAADASPEMLVSLEVAMRYARSAESHARGVRALFAGAVHEHPVLLAAVYAAAYGVNVFEQIEANAQDAYLRDRETAMRAAATHEGSETIN